MCLILRGYTKIAIEQFCLKIDICCFQVQSRTKIIIIAKAQRQTFFNLFCFEKNALIPLNENFKIFNGVCCHNNF